MKLKLDMITAVTAEFAGTADCPVRWVVSAIPRHESRTFAAYGDAPEKHPFTKDKLPKAVQEFIAECVPKRLAGDGSHFMYHYVRKEKI